MNEPNRRDAMLPVSGIVFMVAALGVIIFTQVPLIGTRPPEDVKLYEVSEGVRARLWQDPFLAVVDHVEELQKVAAEGKALPGAAAVIETGPAPHTYAALGEDIRQRQEQQGRVTVLGVMVFGGPYAEDREIRIRWRYAVLSGLRCLGYVAEDAGHIGYVRTDAGGGDEPLRLSGIMPFEWFAGPENRESTLVLWLNEDNFARAPLQHLGGLVEKIRAKSAQSGLPFKIIGPAGSTTLLAMVRELAEPGAGNLPEALKDVAMFSASATAPDRLLLGDPPAGQKSPASVAALLRAKGLQFSRAIGTDDRLVRLLIDELERRQVYVAGKAGSLPQQLRERSLPADRPALEDQAENTRAEDPYRGHRDHVALVAEWDTFYGRSLPAAFVEAIVDRHADQCSHGVQTQRDRKEVTWVHRFSYLRGIDGKIPGEKNKNRDQEKEANEKSAAAESSIERPIGKSQFDYLRRLAERIYHLDQELKHRGHGAIKAIGVLGSDFYDKLLVLQALRQRFPDIIFFTTDLDARLLHPAYGKWTRNLVVASNYGLALDDRIQQDVPPFRDNYQTSIFFTTLLAFGRLYFAASGDPAPVVEPCVFEIGRRQAVRFTVDKDIAGSARVVLTGEAAPGAIHPAGEPRLSEMAGFWKVPAILALALSIMYLISSRGKALAAELAGLVCRNPDISLAALAAGIFVLIKMTALFADPMEEPFSVFQGISVWPTEVLRLAAAVVTLYFIVISFRRLRASSMELSLEFGLPAADRRAAGKKECQGLAEMLKMWPAVRKSQFERLAGFFKGRGDGSLLNGLRQRWLAMSIHGWNRQGREKRPTMDEVWCEYLRRGNGHSRHARFLPVAVLYYLLCLMLVFTFGRPTTPARGEITFVVDRVVLMTSVILFIYLIFFIVDATRLCLRFIQIAVKEQPQWSPASLARFAPGSTGARLEPLAEWMTIRLIAARTDVVGRLIFWPFVVWFLLIISRNRYFDNWHTPVVLAVVIALGAVYAWCCAFVLRRGAEKARSAVVDRLTKAQVRLQSEKTPDGQQMQYLGFVLGDVRSMRKGAFAPLSQHPVVQAVLLPFGGLGGVALLDYLTKLKM